MPNQLIVIAIRQKQIETQLIAMTE